MRCFIKMRPQAFRSAAFFWTATSLVFLLFWVMANYPALTQAWWYRDDFIMHWLLKNPVPILGWMDVYHSFLVEGRPLGALEAGWPFIWNVYPHAGVNITFRWAQGIAHVGATLALAMMLSRHLPHWQASLILLPFLLWAFNGEAVLYASAAFIVWSMILSLAGAHLILTGVERNRPSRCFGGAVLTALALLTYQASATAGMMIWSILLALRLVEDRRLNLGAVREGAWLAAGFFVGGIWTTCLAAIHGSSRAQLPMPEEKFSYWLDLHRTFFFWPKFYPHILDLLHGALLGLALVQIILFLARAGKAGLLLLIPLALGSILPYLANLVVAASAFSFRTFYLAPLFMTMLLAIAFRLTAGSRVWQGILVGLVVAICCNYTVIARQNADDYVRLYLGEVQTISELEKSGLKTHYNIVVVLPDTSTAHAYGITYDWLDAHGCDFTNYYCTFSALDLMAPSLKLQIPLPDRMTLLRKATANLPATPGIHIHTVPALGSLYLEMN
jgi:hypothetical protein